MTDYKKQGEDFLKKTGTTLSVVEAVPQKSPLWAEDGKHGVHYVATLENKRGKYVFDFWGSIADREMLDLAEGINPGNNAVMYRLESPEFFKLKDFLKSKGFPIGMSVLGGRLVEKTKDAIRPGAYDILACLDILYDDTFDDFCSSYGYDVDSIKSEKTYRAVLEQDRMLRRLFTLEEVEALQEIA